MIRTASNRIMAVRGNASLAATSARAAAPQVDDWSFASKSPEVESLDSFSLKSTLTSPNTTNQTTPVARKDMDVFDQIFDNIFSTRESFDLGSSTQSKTPQKAKLMPSIQAMFESKHRHQPTDSFVSIDKLMNMTQAGSVNSSAQLLKSMSKESTTHHAPKQSINITVSQLGQQILSQDLSHDNSAQIIQALTPTVNYMSSLTSDYDLGDFIRVSILDAYISMDEPIESIKKACKAAPSRPPVNALTLPFLLKEAISLLSNQFQAPLEAINIFDEAKRMGVEIFVIGCTTMVYNQVLAAKWAAYRDISMVEDLVREMQINSVYGNTETSILLKSILSGGSSMGSKNGTASGYLWSRSDGIKQKYLEEYRQELNRSLLKSSLKRN